MMMMTLTMMRIQRKTVAKILGQTVGFQIRVLLLFLCSLVVLPLMLLPTRFIAHSEMCPHERPNRQTLDPRRSH